MIVIQLKKNGAVMKRYLQNEEGATALEYGLIAAGISVAIVAVIFLIGGDLNGFFTTISNAISSAGS